MNLLDHGCRRQLPLSLGCAFLVLVSGVAQQRGAAQENAIRLQVQNTNTLLQIQGEQGVDWAIQSSSDLLNWRTLTSLGTLLSGGADAPGRAVDSRITSREFFRAVRTSGLYDPSVFRTISLTFTQSNWQTLLTRGRDTGSNTLGSLQMDNGIRIEGVGVRYKGNSSFQIGGAKKSLNIDMDFTNSAANLMGYSTVNLNNAAGDSTIMREPLYFTVMDRFTVSPKASMAKLFINGQFWGVYSLAQNGDNDLIREWFPSNDGDRWRAPNIGGAAGGRGGGGFASAASALSWQGTNVTRYRNLYELKRQGNSNAWEILVHAIDVLNNTPAAELRDEVEDVLALDRWLWFLVLENVFADDDSYWNKGADYSFYYEPESGRIHPIEHDGNEAFLPADVQLSPVQGASGSNRPVLSRLLGIPELRQRYLAHMRTVLRDAFNPTALTPLIDHFHQMSTSDIRADPKKNFTMIVYTNSVSALRSFVTNRHRFLTNHLELRPVAPTIVSVSGPDSATAGEETTITAEIRPHENEGVDSVWLYFRPGGTGKFVRTEMFDDGAHADGEAADGLYGAATENFLAGTDVNYYVEARSGNSVKTTVFDPARAEQEPYRYHVRTPISESTSIVINEFAAENRGTIADPQGHFDDWIELRNVTDQEVDLTGFYLSDNPGNPRKWPFPDGTKIDPFGYLLVWADENNEDSPGLHATFRLAAGGESISLVGPDTLFNPLLDSVTFGPQQPDRSFGRPAGSPEVWSQMTPTPGAPNL